MNLNCAAGSIEVVSSAFAFALWTYTRNTHPTYPSKLITHQNNALRIVTKSGWYQNVLPLYQKFNVLNLQNLHKFETAKFIHNQIK